MVTVRVSREIQAPLEKVWAVMSIVDNEPQYWHVFKSVKNISREGNVIKREVVIALNGATTMQTVTLDPQTSIETKITEGPVTGTRLVKLTGSDGKTTVDVTWDVDAGGLFGRFSGMFSVVVKKHIGDETSKALERIARAVQ